MDFIWFTKVNLLIYIEKKETIIEQQICILFHSSYCFFAHVVIDLLNKVQKINYSFLCS